MPIKLPRPQPRARITIVAIAIALGFASLVAAYVLLDQSPDSACIREWATLSVAEARDRSSANLPCRNLATDPNGTEPASSGVEGEPLQRIAQASKVRALLVGWIGWTAIAIAPLAAGLVVAVGVAVQIRRLGLLSIKVDPRLLRRTLGPLGLLFLASGAVWLALRTEISPYDDLHEAAYAPIWAALFLIAGLTSVALGLTHHSLREEPWSFEDLEWLGRWQQHSYVLVGAALSLNVVATAARWRLVAELPGGTALPASVVFLFAAIFASAAAVIIAPGLLAWLDVTEEKVQLAVEGERFKGSRREELEELRKEAGVEGGIRGRLLGALAVSSPFAAAILDTFVS